MDFSYQRVLSMFRVYFYMWNLMAMLSFVFTSKWYSYWDLSHPLCDIVIVTSLLFTSQATCAFIALRSYIYTKRNCSPSCYSDYKI